MFEENNQEVKQLSGEVEQPKLVTMKELADHWGLEYEGARRRVSTYGVQSVGIKKSESGQTVKLYNLQEVLETEKVVQQQQLSTALNRYEKNFDKLEKKDDKEPFAYSLMFVDELSVPKGPDDTKMLLALANKVQYATGRHLEYLDGKYQNEVEAHLQTKASLAEEKFQNKLLAEQNVHLTGMLESAQEITAFDEDRHPGYWTIAKFNLARNKGWNKSFRNSIHETLRKWQDLCGEVCYKVGENSVGIFERNAWRIEYIEFAEQLLLGNQDYVREFLTTKLIRK